RSPTPFPTPVTPVPAPNSSQALSFVKSPTPNPCANRICASVTVNFAGSGSNHANVQASCNVATNAKAWDCIQQALGPSNLQFQDFGGSLGVFVSGLYGVEPDFGKCSCFWEFTVNGASSNV